MSMRNPPRTGHPGKPPPRKVQGESTEEQTERELAESKPTPHSYGQSAPMPVVESGTGARPESDGEQASGSQPQSDRHEDQSQYDLEHESLEDLAGEPFREEGEDEDEGEATGNGQ